MVIDITGKLLSFLFYLSILNLIRHTFFLSRSIVNRERFVMDKKTLLLLGMSISYILTYLF